MPTDTREAVKVHYIALTKPELVRATIRKKKDTTRRVIVKQNSELSPGGDWAKLDFYSTFRYSDNLKYEVTAFRDEGFPDNVTKEFNYQYLHVPYNFEENETIYRVYPRWEPGTLLGIKESWAVSDYSRKFPGRLQIVYRAGVTDDHPDGNDCDRLWRDVDMDTWQRYAFKNQWRGPRFMPGWAVRLWATVKSVRPERVQEITEADAVREGCTDEASGSYPTCATMMPPEWYKLPQEERCAKEWYPDNPRMKLWECRNNFIRLWDAINAERGFSWESNCWVWRLEWELLSSTGLEVEK